MVVLFEYCLLSKFNYRRFSKNHQRALDTIQISLEAEARGRLEALRQRKKLEQDVLELEAALEATVKARADVEKNYKRFQQQIRDLELVVEEEQAAAQVQIRVNLFLPSDRRSSPIISCKLCSTNLFLHSLLGFLWTAFTELKSDHS